MGNWIARAIWELGRGLGLILRDIHGFFYGRLGARIWWVYIGIAFVACLLITGQFWNLVIQALIVVFTIGLLWWLVRLPFRGRRQERRRND